MNTPGRIDGNWRCTEEMLRSPAFAWLRNLTSTSNRLSTQEEPAAQPP
jgi:hypothetical protein